MNAPRSTPTSKRSPLGEILVAQGMLTQAELDAALFYRTERGLKLGQALVALGLVSQADLGRALQSQGRLHCLHLTPEIVDRSVARELGEERSRKMQAIAVNRIAGVVTIAMEDPSELYDVDALSLHLQAPVIAVHSEPESIARCLEAVFARSEPPARAAADPLVALLAAGPGAAGASGRSEGFVAGLVQSLLEEAQAANASDVHLEPRQDGLQVRFRVDGVLCDRVSLPRHWVRPLIMRLKGFAGLDLAEQRLPQDGRAQVEIRGKPADLRIATSPTLYGEGAVLRLVDGERKLPELGALGLAPKELETLKRMVESGEGLVLATGPNGSGRTTTLYALLQHLRSPGTKIVTLEDPVERTLEGATQISLNSEIGLDFARGLRASLRQDPDIVLLGELAERETADLALQAALTGRLVLSTLHTGGTAEAVTRLVDMGLERYLLADSLRGIVAQRLVRRICPRCRHEAARSGELRTRLQLPGDLVFYEGAGCPACGGSGFKGRLALYEILSLDAELASAVRDGTEAEELRALAVEHGMLTMREDGLRRALAGETTLHEVHFATARS